MKYAILALAVAGASHTAAAGVPAWCKSAPPTRSALADDLKSPDPITAVSAIALFSCDASRESDAIRHDIDAIRAAWSKKLGLADADWVEAVQWAVTSHSLDPYLELSTKNLATLTPSDQFIAIAQEFKNDAHYAISDPLYVADALDAHLTETGRLAFLQWCFTKDDDGARWAICQADFDAFDVNKLYRELAGDASHAGPTRFWMRVHGYAATQQIADVKARAAKLVAKDDAWKTLWDAAAAARADWKAAVGGNAALLALAESTDSGVLLHSRKVLDGCEAKTAAAVRDAAATLPASAFRGMHDDGADPFKGFIYKAGPLLANTPAVDVALIAYIECQPKAGLSVTMSQYVAGIPGYRGPRSAALGAVMAANPKFDDARTNVHAPGFGPRPYRHEGGAAGSAGGVAKTVKPGSIALEKTMIKTEDCVAEHDTNRIARITDRVEYVKVCDKTATVTHDVTWDDFTMEPGAEALVKPGNVFSATYGTRDGSAVIAVWPSKTALLPSSVLGAKLK